MVRDVVTVVNTKYWSTLVAVLSLRYVREAYFDQISQNKDVDKNLVQMFGRRYETLRGRNVLNSGH